MRRKPRNKLILFIVMIIVFLVSFSAISASDVDSTNYTISNDSINEDFLEENVDMNNDFYQDEDVDDNIDESDIDDSNIEYFDIDESDMDNSDIEDSDRDDSNIEDSDMDNSDIDEQYESDKIETTISMSFYSTNYGIDYDSEVISNDNISIYGFLYDIDENGIPNQNVSIHINDENYILSYEIVTDEEGFYSCDSFIPELGKQYEIQAEYKGNDEYSSSEEYQTLTVVYKDLPSLTIYFESQIKPNENLYISGQLTDSDDNGIANQELSLIITDELDEIVSDNIIITNEYGYYEYTTNIFNQTGNYYIQMSYDGNDDYLSTEDIFDLTVSNLIETRILFDEITQENDVLSITGQLTDYQNKGIANETLIITVIDVEDTHFVKTVITDEDGYFEYNESLLNNSVDYDIEAYYDGNEDYMASYAYSMALNSNKEPTQITLDYISDEIYLFDDLEISGYLTDSRNNTLDNQSVIVSVSNKNGNIFEESILTDENGYFNCSLNVNNVSDYDVNVIYSGKDFYSASNDFTSFKVINLTTPILKLDNITVIQKNRTAIITGQLKDYKCNPIVNKTLNIILLDNIDHDIYGYEAITDANGVYQLTINNPSDSVNEYRIEVKSPRDDKYSSNYLFDSFSFEGIKTSLFLKLNDYQISGSLIDKNNNGLSNEEISIEINDQTENKTVIDYLKTDESGKYVYNYSFNENHSFSFKVKFEGNEYYASSQMIRVHMNAYDLSNIKPEPIIEDINNDTKTDTSSTIVTNSSSVVEDKSYNTDISNSTPKNLIEVIKGNSTNITAHQNTKEILTKKLNNTFTNKVVLLTNAEYIPEITGETNQTNISNDAGNARENMTVQDDKNNSGVSSESENYSNYSSIILFGILLLIVVIGLIYYISKR